MKKNYFYGLLVLAIFAVIGCSDSLIQEPTPPLPEQQKEMTHEVTQAEARQQLEEILLDMKIPSTRGTMSSVPNITSAHTTGKYTRVTRSTETVEPYFHIFNFGDNEGFAIMSGDDRVEPLLALTYKGELTPDTEIDNPNFQLAYSKIEEYYVEQVMRGGGEPNTDPILPIDSIADDPHLRWEDGEPFFVYYDMPYGHCPVTWGQEYPYNRLCFTSDGQLAYTGCVATAVAQLMATYKHPTTYSNDNSNYRFPWSIMIDSTNSLASGPIARLMYVLGLPQNLAMTYGAVGGGVGSSADPERIPATLENMGYTCGGSFVSYNGAEVCSELRAGYPVLIGGRDGLNRGHRWLGHGIAERKQPVYAYEQFGRVPVDTLYHTTVYILCNMGWDGVCDGYYVNQCFNTNTTRSGVAGDYSNHLTVVKGIRK